MTWHPTESFLKGTIIKPFLPNDKHSKLRNPNLKNLYPGDQVLVFETKDKKWGRGYVVKMLMPEDFVSTSCNLDDLQVQKSEVVVFPLPYVKIQGEIPLPDFRAKKVAENADVPNVVPTLHESEADHKDAVNGSGLVADGGDNIQTHNTQNKPEIPPYPAASAHLNEDICDEIKYALELLTAQVFALYSMGEFRLYEKLSTIYRSLLETRIKLTHNLLTKDETQIAKETAIFLLNDVSKKLTSRISRLNASAYDLDNDRTDISGFKSILARDIATAEVLNLNNSIPARIALNSELGALVTNFPINAHNHALEYSLRAPPNKKFKPDPPSHILVDFKSVSGSSAYQPPGFAGTTAYMYLRNSDKRLTEAFAVHTDSVDDLVNVEKISAALFKNLPSSEIINNRVFLVAVLTEEVDLNVRTSNQVPVVKRVKKGVAAGIADITRIFSHNEGSLVSGEPHRFSIKLFGSYVNRKGTLSSKLGDGANENNGWGELVDRIIAGSGHGIAVNPRAERLVVTVKEFKHQFTGTTLQDISATAPISRIKPIFFDPLAENYERIYLRMGKVTMVNNSSKDDLITIEVSTPNNDLISFAKASNQQEERFWQFISIFPGEAIGEIVKVNGVALKSTTQKLPKDDHIVLSFYVNGVLTGEGKLLYKAGNRLVEFNKKKTHAIEILSTVHNVPIAHVELSTEYVGKIYNSDLSIDNIFLFENFLKQGSKGLDELSNSLVSFCRLDIGHLVKYFPELLTSLYGIVDAVCHLSGPSVEILGDSTFKAIVHLLDTIFGRQDQYFYLIDDFASKYKRLDQVGIFLLQKLEEIFSRSQVTWNATSRSVCRVSYILMRFAIGSLDDSPHKDRYQQALGSLFRAVAKFLAIDSPQLIDDQVLILGLVDYIISFSKNMDNNELLKLMILFIDSAGIRGAGADELTHDATVKRANKEHKVVVAKLLLILRLLGTTMVDERETRHTLIAKSVNWVMEIFLGPTDVEATRLGCSILNVICTILWDKVVIAYDTTDLELCFSLVKFIPALARTFIKYNKHTRGNGYFKSKRTFTQLFPTNYPIPTFSIDQLANDEVMVEVLVELASCFCFVARIGKATAGEGGLVTVLNTELKHDFFDPSKYLAANFANEDLLTVIAGIRYLRLGRYFPEDKWLSFYAVIIEGCMCALELIRPLIISYQLPGIDDSEHFDRALWGNYMKALLRLAVLPPVAVEYLSDIPKRACGEITHDIRDRAASLLEQAWDSLAWEATEEDMVRFNLHKFGGFQVEFINDEFSILQELMLFALQRNLSCHNVAVKILWSILVSEYIVSDNLREVERECLIGLSEIYQKPSYKPTKQDQDGFIDRLKSTIRIDREDIAFGAFNGFVQGMAEFCSTLNYYASVPVGPEFDEDRMFHQIKLKAQIKAAGKPEYFNTFVSSMYEDNVRKNDFAQAALTLELLASTYSWDHHEIVPMSFRPKFPQQTSFERKEMLYKMIAANFVKGKSLEKAADTLNELLDAYNEHTYDLKSFAHVHSKLAQLYLDLESSDKLEPSYFRVEAIGKGFPYYMRIISQIYQGMPYEHITSMHERLMKLFPGAIIINDDNEAKRLKEDPPTGRYLYIKAVEPVWEFSDKLVNTSLGVRQYARNKDLRYFSSLKKIPGSTSVFDLWTEQTVYEAWLSFPTLFNRSFIKDAKTVKLSPLDNAIRTIGRKNEDLVLLESLINACLEEKADYSEHFNDLSRQLTGTVDSPVNGGVGQYRLFFTDPKYLENEEDARKADLLNKAFNELAIILSRCLALHGKLVAPSMKGAHDVLVDLFEKNFKDEIEMFKLTQKMEATSTSRVSLFQEKRSLTPSASAFNERGSTSNYNPSNYANSTKGSSYATSSQLNRTNTNSSMRSSQDSRLGSSAGGIGGGSSGGFGGSHQNYGLSHDSNSTDNASNSASYSQFSGLASRSTATNGLSSIRPGSLALKKAKSAIQKKTAINGNW